MVLPRGGAMKVVVRLERSLKPLMQRRRPPRGTGVAQVGETAVRLHQPTERAHEPRPALLWIHGGGYVIGSPAEDDAFCAMLSQRLGIVVAAVDYRLAPEHAFPTPLHDCHDALVWLSRRRDVDSTRIAIVGASAGGGLAAALALLARDRGEVRPVLQLLSYPMLDDRTVQRVDLDERNFRLWNNKANHFGWTSYLGRAPGSTGVSGLASPARHEDLTGLPPTWIGVGTCDLFHDENAAYAGRLEAAGVKCDLHVAEGGFHAFDMIRPKATISVRYRDSQLAALQAALLGAPRESSIRNP